MNKKFFVVLVVVAAMLFTFSLVIGAKKAIHKGTPLTFEKSEYQDKQTATLVEIAPVEPQQAMVVSGVKRGIAIPVEGTPTELGPIDKTDMCDMYGFAAYYYGGAVWGLELWANFQDPYQFAYPAECVDVFPCSVIAIQFDVNVAGPVHMDIRPIVYDNAGTSCPIPGAELCTGPVAGFDIPGAGWWTLGMNLDPGCCMYEPYFAGIEIQSDHSAAPLDAIIGSDGTPCVSYNDWQGFWEDIVVDWGAPGMLLLSSVVMTRLQNECVEVPFCCQFADYCSMDLTPTDCINAGGTPAPDLRYQCIGDVCMLPWMGDTCTVESVLPPTFRLLAGDTAQYEVTVAFEGAQTECNLTIDPDPPCPTCVATFNPNPVQSPNTTSTLTIVTDPTTPVGVYTFEVNGAKVSASVEVVAPSDQCEMYRDDEAWAWFSSVFVVGDQQVVYFNPDELCPGCGADLYPFYVDRMKIRLYDHQGAGTMDYIFKIYASTGNPCDGPQQLLLSWPVDGVTDFSNWVEYPLPEILCVDDPFFFALEFNYDPGVYLPCALWTDQPYLVPCCQFVYHDDVYTAWEDFWADPKGYMSIRALGTCADENCPVVCNMQQDVYSVGIYNSGWQEGDQIVKYYDPEVYCVPDVYPYKIDDLDFALYDFGGMGSVDIAVRVYLQCQDSCDGPGTPIYESDPITITTFFGAWAHVDLDELICVYEPFFIGIEYLEGVAGSTPSMIFDKLHVEPYPYRPDTCHTYFWKGAGWVEHYDFWSKPDSVGYPFIRVSGFTNHPECAPPSCDTTLEILWGGEWAHYVWTIPDSYGDDFFNEKFEMPIDHGGRLEYIEFCFDPDYTVGTPDPDFYVWMSDGTYPLDNNPPYQAIAEFHFPYDSVLVWPAYTRYYTYSHAIEFEPGEMFHVGYSHAQETGDVLAILSDDGSVGFERSSELWNGMWGLMVDDWGVDVNFMINAVICPFAVAESTFIMRCSPAVGFATPGDPPVDVYQVELSSIAGYSLPVTLSLLSVTPPVAITATFDPNGVPVPFTSDVAIQVDGAVSYGDYVLEFEAVGGDGQTRTCGVTLTVQPPYDEADVPFYHGSQKATNFGAVGNDAAPDNFLWYTREAQLFDGSFVIATTDADHMALDIYNCYYWGWEPPLLEHIDCWHDADYNANICYSNFFSGTNVPGEFDSVFIVGIMEECIDFSIKIKVYYNDGPDPIEGMYLSLFEDWDVGVGQYSSYNNWGDMDSDHNLMWMYDPLEDTLVFGIMKAPFYDDLMYNMVHVRNPQYVWPNAGFCDDAGGFWGLDSLYWLIARPGFFPPEQPDTDFSMMMTAGPIDLLPGERHIEVWIDFGRNLNDGYTWEQWWHRVLRYAGFYRGDCDASDTLEIPALDVSDLAYLINYLFKEGPAPLPYRDQGDVNADGDVNIEDVVYMLNYVFIEGPPPKDYVRFIPQLWWRWSLFATDLWR